MPNMKHCMFENTSGDLYESIEKLEETHDLEDLDEYERRGVKQLRQRCAEFVEAYDNKFGEIDEE